MKVIEPIIENISEEIFDLIRNRPFFVVSYDRKTGKFIRHVQQMSSQDIVFCCNAMIKQELEECEDLE